MWWSPCQPSQPSQPSPRDSLTESDSVRGVKKRRRSWLQAVKRPRFLRTVRLTWWSCANFINFSWIVWIYFWIFLIMMSNDSLWLMIQTYSNIFWWADYYLDNILIDLIWLRLLFKGFNGRAGTWRLEQVETCHTWRSSVLRIGVVSQLHDSMETPKIPPI